MNNSRLKQSGFTLIEILLATLVFALVSMASFAVLDSVLKSDEASRQKIEELQALQRAFFIMERDFRQVSQRHVRANGERASRSVFAGGKFILESEGDAVAFVKDGWRNPGMVLPRSELQSVAYRMKEENLERMFFVYTDPVAGEEPRTQILLKDIEELTFEYMASSDWKEQWEEVTLPQAVAVKVKTKSFGEIRRIFILPETAQQVNSDGNQNGNGRGGAGGGNNPGGGNNNGGGSKGGGSGGSNGAKR